ncbi:zinc-dependent alcohol dehydrogenase [Delftia sp. PS-11]|uniref:zinc-dependent alcohol dehydrogenase n=1 Tax=Delftia sp. PS-11 TaxID=2767222 RepID=UPI002457737E|nr:alcohol dehydrogenase catalytic domain-containing protein [Delftia sp. PS-11]KAJ8742537.1 alcohol dehydrogenase catalytic domain-containing protein [Delftia sp. PS-11]
MQALRKTEPAHGLTLTQADMPEPGPGEVLLRVHSAGVCGTDLHIAEWTPSYHFLSPALPVTIGHEFSGEIVAHGAGAEGLPLGQLVAVRPSVTCGRCVACEGGNFDACTTRRGIGVMRNGGFAPWAAVPLRNCVPVPAGVDGEVAALAEPLTVSHEAVRTAGIRPGDRVLVLGPGNIGQGIALFARDAAAAQVVVAGHGDGPRLQVLRAMGFTDLLDFEGTDMDSALAPYLAQGRFDAVIEATGAAAVIAPALRALRPHGTLVITGIHAAPVPVDLTALVRNHQSLRGSYRAPESAWPQVVRFMQENQPLLRHMITHRVPLAQAAEGFALARARHASKVLVQPAAQA